MNKFFLLFPLVTNKTKRQKVQQAISKSLNHPINLQKEIQLKETTWKY